MVIFILAAAAAFLLCGPFAPEQLSNWLKENKHALRLILFLFLLAAVLLILVTAAATPRDVGAIMLGLPILILVLGVGSLLNRLPTSPPRPVPQPIPVPYRPLLTRSSGSEPRTRPDEIPAVEWPCRRLLFVLLGLLVISPLAAVGLFEREVIVVRVPAVIVSWVPVGLPWFLATYNWLIVVVLYALFTRSANPAFKWLRRQKWLTRLTLSSLLSIALFSTLIAWNEDAWAYAVLLTIRRIASMPETTYGVLGAVAGLMCGIFLRG